MIHQQTKRYEWDGTEHEHVEKSVDWYWGLGIVMVTGIIIAIISKNYLLAVLLFIGGILLGYYANDKPEAVHIEISERGIKLDETFYTYETMRSFWMYQDHKKKNQLMLITGRSVLPERILLIPDDINVLELHAFLLERLTEKETKPSSINVIAESLGL
jgi:hypothetical protein